MSLNYLKKKQQTIRRHSASLLWLWRENTKSLVYFFFVSWEDKFGRMTEDENTYTCKIIIRKSK